MKNYNKLIEKFLNSHEFGQKVYNDYYGVNNKAGFLQDQATFNRANIISNKLIRELKKIQGDELAEACARTFCGRLEFNGEKFSYTAGQFYDAEIPHAVQAVLEYIKRNRTIE